LDAFAPDVVEQVRTVFPVVAIPPESTPSYATVISCKTTAFPGESTATTTETANTPERKALATRFVGLQNFFIFVFLNHLAHPLDLT
jgi:hypothetical protein